MRNVQKNWTELGGQYICHCQNAKLAVKLLQNGGGRVGAKLGDLPQQRKLLHYTLLRGLQIVQGAQIQDD